MIFVKTLENPHSKMLDSLCRRSTQQKTHVCTTGKQNMQQRSAVGKHDDDGDGNGDGDDGDDGQNREHVQQCEKL